MNNIANKYNTKHRIGAVPDNRKNVPGSPRNLLSIAPRLLTVDN